MAAFTGVCRVHRAEVLQLHGDWRARSGRRSAHARVRGRLEEHRGGGILPGGRALPPAGRVRGCGAGVSERQPGRVRSAAWARPAADGARASSAAAAAIARALSATTDQLGRARLLPACVEIMLAAGDPEGADAACGELEATARSFDTDALAAMAAHARGAVRLAHGAAEAALCSLRRAFELWQTGRGSVSCRAGARA